jgi:hypothetical protein
MIHGWLALLKPLDARLLNTFLTFNQRDDENGGAGQKTPTSSAEQPDITSFVL